MSVKTSNVISKCSNSKNNNSEAEVFDEAKLLSTFDNFKIDKLYGDYVKLSNRDKFILRSYLKTTEAPYVLSTIDAINEILNLTVERQPVDLTWMRRKKKEKFFGKKKSSFGGGFVNKKKSDFSIPTPENFEKVPTAPISSYLLDTPMTDYAKICTALNKLTKTNISKIAEEIISFQLKTKEEMADVAKIFFEKVVSDEVFNEHYTVLFSQIRKQFKCMADINKGGSGPTFFQHCLLKLAFEKIKKDHSFSKNKATGYETARTETERVMIFEKGELIRLTERKKVLFAMDFIILMYNHKIIQFKNLEQIILDIMAKKEIKDENLELLIRVVVKGAKTIPNFRMEEYENVISYLQANAPFDPANPTFITISVKKAIDDYRRSPLYHRLRNNQVNVKAAMATNSAKTMKGMDTTKKNPFLGLVDSQSNSSAVGGKTSFNGKAVSSSDKKSPIEETPINDQVVNVENVKNKQSSISPQVEAAVALVNKKSPLTKEDENILKKYIDDKFMTDFIPSIKGCSEDLDLEDLVGLPDKFITKKQCNSSFFWYYFLFTSIIHPKVFLTMIRYFSIEYASSIDKELLHSILNRLLKELPEIFRSDIIATEGWPILLFYLRIDNVISEVEFNKFIKPDDWAMNNTYLVRFKESLVKFEDDKRINSLKGIIESVTIKRT